MVEVQNETFASIEKSQTKNVIFEERQGRIQDGVGREGGGGQARFCLPMRMRAPSEL